MNQTPCNTTPQLSLRIIGHCISLFLIPVFTEYSVHTLYFPLILPRLSIIPFLAFSIPALNYMYIPHFYFSGFKHVYSKRNKIKEKEKRKEPQSGSNKRKLPPNQNFHLLSSSCSFVTSGEFLYNFIPSVDTQLVYSIPS